MIVVNNCGCLASNPRLLSFDPPLVFVVSAVQQSGRGYQYTAARWDRASRKRAVEDFPNQQLLRHRLRRSSVEMQCKI
jgi:hypothetical protein